MPEKLSPIEQWHSVSKEQFENEIIPRNQPAVLKGLVKHWPIVQADSESVPSMLCDMDSGKPAYTVVGQPEIKGRFFYRDDLQGVNFQRSHTTISKVIEQLLKLAGREESHALAIQAAPVREVLPAFRDDQRLPILSPSIEPTLWMGNQVIVAPHYDVSDNIACVVAGKRSFTLFPPEQISNLYIGPSLDAPGGVPISLVDINNPDLERYPRFEEALKSAQNAMLEPGDAIYIPSPWWHAVESLNDFNVLINYWWSNTSDALLSPNQSMMHSMLSIAKLSADKRQSWHHFFEYLVFKTKGDPADHLPTELKDVVTSLTPEQRQRVFQYLKNSLNN